MAIAKIKSFIDTSLKTVGSPIDRTTTSLEPEIGIRIVHSPDDKSLRVTVLGARHLPQNFGFTRVNSYVVKIKLIPGKDKHETTTRNESWPQWNEEFVFPLRKETKVKFGKNKVVEEEIGASKFVVATLYAILEDKPLIATDKKENEKDKANTGAGRDKKDGGKKKDAKQQQDPSSCQSASTMQSKGASKLLNQFFGKGSDKIGEPAGQESARKAFEKRRTIGATSIPLDPRNFTSKPVKPKHPQDVSTGDMWRTLKPISSGISGAEERRENKKGQVELSLCQEKREAGNGRLVLTMHRLRCSLQSMQEHEALKGHMYIKMSVVDTGRVTYFWKSDRFAPCVSMKFDPGRAQVMIDNPYEGALKDVCFVVKFVAKNKIGKKVTVGHFVIGPEVGGPYSEMWKQALAKPGQQVSKWLCFE
ncbi:uncharacterized protein LOC106643703 [Copidosoma floridanum]|uniref:uncharacterized protein LOC106643703 n=1 Tax=Copidosoma floridanum TaxID=29053 RepID=UPI0006C95512|nr:uncharacterized protein LOC106643703 [Copidosoma floridanum]XP_014214430.1 uncharacterized protein LOC106643703 [Copidosoma floridanum]